MIRAFHRDNDSPTTRQRRLHNDGVVKMGISRVLASLLPAALVTALFSFYHVTVLTNQNCFSSSERDEFGVPIIRNAKASPHNITQSFTSKQQQSHDKEYNGPYKVYSKWKEPFPCVPMDPQWKTIKVQRSPATEGLLYVREMKTGSSTLAGVVLRIAHRKAKSLLRNNKNDLPCKLRVDHSPARLMNYGNRDKKRSFLISLLRDPTKRVMSQFFHFKVSEDGATPSDANFQSYLQNNTLRLRNYYVRDLSMTKINVASYQDNNYKALVQDILNEYDFIGITERMDESLIVLKNLLNLSFGDILYMSAKNAGSFTAAGGGPKKPPRCIYIVPSFVTPGMKRYFESNEWQQFIAADTALYQAANASLDKTIDSLGRRLVEKELATFQKLKEQAQEKCVERTIYRCDATGTFVGIKNATCLLWDVGCGHKCLEEFAQEIAI